MIRAGIYGGNFDPVHYGHLITAMMVKEERNLDKIIFIPAFISPLKPGSLTAEGNHRFNMLQYALKDINFFECSALELKRGGISYTIDTLRIFKQEYDHLDLIIGYDNLLVFTEWKNPDIITELADLVVLGRKSSEDIKHKNRFFDKAYFAETPLIEISSTMIRDRIRKNLPVNFLVPDSVRKYITDNNLYKD